MTVDSQEDEKPSRAVVAEAGFKAGYTVQAYSTALGGADLASLFGIITKDIVQAQKGNLSKIEAHLVAQSIALDSIFHSLALRATQAEYMEQIKVFLSLALKAQNQSRMTLETLARIKNPQPYVRQQNVAVNQQVNNGSPAPPRYFETAPTPARGREEKQKMTTEVLELENGEYEHERMDTRAPGAAGGTHTDVEAVATLHRAENGRGQGHEP